MSQQRSVLCALLVTLLFKNMSSIQNFSALGVIVTRGKQSERIPLANLNSLIRNAGFDSRLPTVLYIPGWQGDAYSYCTETVAKAYWKKGGFNFLIVDWSKYNNKGIVAVTKSIGPVGDVIGEKLYQMAKSGLINLDSWHFMGHSASCHLVSWIAKSIKIRSSGSILVGRVTGLDPSGFVVYDASGKAAIEEAMTKDAGN